MTITNHYKGYSFFYYYVTETTVKSHCNIIYTITPVYIINYIIDCVAYNL